MSYGWSENLESIRQEDFDCVSKLGVFKHQLYESGWENSECMRIMLFWKKLSTSALKNKNNKIIKSFMSESYLCLKLPKMKVGLEEGHDSTEVN